MIAKSTGSSHAEEEGEEGGAVDILPECGRAVVFLSSEIPHEVLPTFADRHAVTIWYYDKEERAAAIMKAKEAGKAASAAKTKVESQVEARKFIAEMLDGKKQSVSSSMEGAFVFVTPYTPFLSSLTASSTVKTPRRRNCTGCESMCATYLMKQ